MEREEKVALFTGVWEKEANPNLLVGQVGTERREASTETSSFLKNDVIKRDIWEQFLWSCYSNWNSGAEMWKAEWLWGAREAREARPALCRQRLRGWCRPLVPVLRQSLLLGPPTCGEPWQLLQWSPNSPLGLYSHILSLMSLWTTSLVFSFSLHQALPTYQQPCSKVQIFKYSQILPF